MEAITDHLIGLGFSVVSAGLFTLIGFVWKTSHKVGQLEKQLNHQKEIASRDAREFRRDIDNIIDNVDKNREWSTSRLMSIAKDIPRG
jgi:hypothetical protein